MKFVIVAALALVAVACAAPAEPEPVQIVRSEFEQQPDGPYSASFESADGIVRSETGELREVLDAENKPQKVIVVRGSYRYVDPEGKNQEITYFADETGYHAEGEAIPKQVAARR